MCCAFLLFIVAPKIDTLLLKFAYKRCFHIRCQHLHQTHIASGRYGAGYRERIMARLIYSFLRRQATTFRALTWGLAHVVGIGLCCSSSIATAGGSTISVAVASLTQVEVTPCPRLPRTASIEDTRLAHPYLGCIPGKKLPKLPIKSHVGVS